MNNPQGEATMYYMVKALTQDETFIFISKDEQEVLSKRTEWMNELTGAFFLQPIHPTLTPANKKYAIFGTSFHNGKYYYFIYHFDTNSVVYKGTNFERLIAKITQLTIND